MSAGRYLSNPRYIYRLYKNNIIKLSYYGYKSPSKLMHLTNGAKSGKAREKMASANINVLVFVVDKS
jgi:hypothetical protein